MPVTTVPEGIDADGVERYLRAQGLTDRLHGATLLEGGSSNLTYVLHTSSGDLVLRRPPLGHVLPTAHDMSREYRVISALAGTDVAVPRALALCTDTAVNGSPFYIMDYCQGVVIIEDLPGGVATTPDERRRLSVAFVDMLARLHAVDYTAVGLGDFGRPDGYLARQVRRWDEQWQRSKTREMPAVDELHRRLAASIPASPPPTIVHGDFRLGNVMVDAADPGRVVAVFDWEMATLGDPLSDLGWLVATWLQPGDSAQRADTLNTSYGTMAEGFLSRDEMIAEYARRTRHDLSNIEFYVVLALYKLAVVVEGIHARWLAGETLGEGQFSEMGRRAPMVADLALELADDSTMPALRGEGI